MTTPATNDNPDDADPTGEGAKPGSGHGAESALSALIKQRVPAPDLPPAEDEPAG
jgi:hypothetical protein